MEQKKEKTTENRLNPLPNLLAGILGEMITFIVMYAINPSEGLAAMMFCIVGIPFGFLAGFISYLFERLFNTPPRKRYVFFILTLMIFPAFFIIFLRILYS